MISLAFISDRSDRVYTQLSLVCIILKLKLIIHHHHRRRRRRVCGFASSHITHLGLS